MQLTGSAPLGTAEDRSSFHGRVNDDGSDYIGFRKSLTAVFTTTGGDLSVSMQPLDALTDLTPEEISTMGAAGGLSTDSSTVFVTRLDTPGRARIVVTGGLAAPGGSLLFDSISGEVGDSGITVADGVATFDAGTYAVRAHASIDVFWG